MQKHLLRVAVVHEEFPPVQVRQSYFKAKLKSLALFMLQFSHMPLSLPQTWSGIWELYIEVPNTMFVGFCKKKNQFGPKLQSLHSFLWAHSANMIQFKIVSLFSIFIWVNKSSDFCKTDDKLSMFSVTKIDKIKCPMVITFLIMEGSLTSKHLAIIPDESVP